jgi:hypothetical protein
MSDPVRPSDDDEPFDLERAPLDAPDEYDTDWGGDGSDPTRPVRAHVLAALRPSSAPYAPPLDALLTAGETADIETLLEEGGIGQEHIPELIRLVRDRALHTADSESPEAWAPLHGLLLLQELGAGAQVEELVPLFDIDNDLFAEELSVAIGQAGAPAIPPLRAYLEDHTRWVWGHSRAAEALKELAERHPELRAEVVELLSALLARAEEYEIDSATGILGALIDLKAVEALPVIRRVHELGQIDETMHGPWEEVLEELGLEPELGDPLLAESRRRFQERRDRMFRSAPQLAASTPRAAQPRPAPAPRRSDEKKKAKNKRKTSSASRKANKKKKRK